MKDFFIKQKDRIKKLVTENYKMKLLVLYLIANLLYILIGSYIFMTGQITEDFHYLEFSRGLRNILVLNVIVFLIICFEKKYKKNYLHFFIIPIVVFRNYFCLFCL